MYTTYISPLVSLTDGLGRLLAVLSLILTVLLDFFARFLHLFSFFSLSSATSLLTEVLCCYCF